MIAALVILAVAFVANAVVHRLAIRDVTRLFGQIEARAHAERHVLAGRIHRPELFPTAPVAAAPAPLAPGEAPEIVPPPQSGFEAAGMDLEHKTPDELIELFGAEFVHGE